MSNLPLNKTVIMNRLSEIEANIVALQKIKEVPFEEFNESVYAYASESHLHRALEAVFDIAGHIISRLTLRPAERPDGYKLLALALGKYKIVPETFAKEKLVQMAGYRNRLVHFYDEVTQEELYGIIQHDLTDLEDYCAYIKKLVEDPQKFDFEIK